MRVSLSIRDIDELFAELSYQTGSTVSSKEYEHLLTFPSRICSGCVKRYALRPGFELSVQSTLFQEHLVLETEFNSAAPFTLGFCISGDFNGTVKGIREELNFSSGKSIFGVASHMTGAVEYCAGKLVTVVSISFDCGVLDALLGGFTEPLPTLFQDFVEGKDESPYLQTSWMTPTLKTIALQILNCPYQGLTKRLYLEGKAIEALACFLEQLSSNPEKSAQIAFLKPTDIERIHRAKEILLSDLAHPPSLAGLGKLVGLNDHKLKIGFRQVLGTTVFGYLREHRMQYAKELLTTRALSIVEIARAVGYASETSFSAAFKKVFGVPPTVYRASPF